MVRDRSHIRIPPLYFHKEFCLGIGFLSCPVRADRDICSRQMPHILERQNEVGEGIMSGG